MYTVPNEDRIDQIANNMSDYQEDFLRDLYTILAIPSTNGPTTNKYPYGENTGKVLDSFLAIAEGMGFKTKNLDYHAGYVEYGEGEQMIAVLCHLDVVPAGEGWSSDPFSPRLIDGLIYARGVADDKGPAMINLYAMKALKDEGFMPNCRIRLIVGLNEESGFGCMKHYIKIGEEMPVAGYTSDASFPAVFAEKGIIRISFKKSRKLSGKGIEIHSLKGGEAVNMVPQVCRYRLQKNGQVLEETEIEGKASHASRPELGENAIVKTLGLLAEEHSELEDTLLEIKKQYFVEHIFGEDLGVVCEDESGKLTLNLGLIDVTPDEMNFTLDIRYPVTASGSDIINKLEEKFREYGLSTDIVRDEAPLNLGKDSDMIQMAMKIYNDNMGTDEPAVAMGGGTYARAIPNIFAFGAVFPGTPDSMHQVDENAKLNHLLAASYIYKETLRSFAEKLI